MKWSEVKSLSHVWLFATPWTVAYRAPLSMGFFQARVLEWVVAMVFSRGSSRPRDQTQVSCIAGRRFTVWATREAFSHRLKSKLWHSRLFPLRFQSFSHSFKDKAYLVPSSELNLAKAFAAPVQCHAFSCVRINKQKLQLNRVKGLPQWSWS